MLMYLFGAMEKFRAHLSIRQMVGHHFFCAFYLTLGTLGFYICGETPQNMRNWICHFS